MKEDTYTILFEGIPNVAVGPQLAAAKALAAFDIQVEHEHKQALARQAPVPRIERPVYQRVVDKLRERNTYSLPRVGLLPRIIVEKGAPVLEDRTTEGKRTHVVHAKLSRIQRKRIDTIMRREGLRTMSDVVDWLVYQDRLSHR